MSNKTDGFVNTCAAAEMGQMFPFLGLILSRKILLPFCEHWAAARPVGMEDCPHVSRYRLAPCPYHGRNSWMGKERR